MNGLQRMSASIMTHPDEQIQFSPNISNKGAHESLVPSSLNRNDSSGMASSRHQSNVFFDSPMVGEDDADMQSSNHGIHYTSVAPSSTNNTSTTMMQRPSLLHQVSLLGSSTSDLNRTRSTDQMLNNMNATNVPFTSASQNVSSSSSSSSDMSTEKKDESNTASDLSDARRLSQMLKDSHMLGVTRKTRSAGQNLMFMKHKEENHHNGANTTNSLRSIRFRSFTNGNSDMSMQANSSFKFASSNQQQPKRNMFLDMLKQPTQALETRKKQPVNPYFSPPQGQTQQPISSVSSMSLSGMNLSNVPPRPILRQQGSFKQRHSSGNMKRSATFALRRNIRVHDAMESTNTNSNGGIAMERHCLVKRRRL